MQSIWMAAALEETVVPRVCWSPISMYCPMSSVPLDVWILATPCGSKLMTFWNEYWPEPIAELIGQSNGVTEAKFVFPIW